VTERPAPIRNTHIAALDGVRALAIAVVIAYHADLVAFPGGFLGVETFFVLSGFLVTAGLVAELERRGQIRFVPYAIRRVRRLAPALIAMVGSVAVVVLVGFPDQLSHLRRGALGALTGSGNWLELANGDYFATFGRGPVFRHLWSFAVEVQGYAILPLVVGLLWALSGWNRNRLAQFLFVLAVSGYAWQAVVAVRYPGSSRAYFGTDTRIGALLMGASVAALDRKRVRAELPDAALTILAFVSLLGLGGLVAVVEGTDLVLYRGILALTGLLSALLVFAVAISSESIVAIVLGSAPLRWVGTRSYGLYLWHWPIFVLTRPVAGVPMGLLPFVIRVGLACSAAELSFRFIESRATRSPAEVWSRRRVTEIGVAGLAGFLVFGVVTATPARSDDLGASAVAIPVPVVAPPPTQSPSVIQVSTTTLAPVESVTPATIVDAPTIPPTTSAPTPTTTTSTLPPLPPLPPGLVGDDVTLIGDSVLRAAEPALRARLGLNATIDSKVGRQFVAGVDLVKELRAEGRLKPIVVVALGTNGPFREADIDALIAELHDRKTLAFVQVEVPRRWKKSVNERLVAAKLQHPSIVLIDWPSRVKASKLRLPDGVHPAPKAAASYADLLIEALGASVVAS
jgi:peptidoglycan/LPS O-acetylase OafA/YrhL